MTRTFKILFIFIICLINNLDSFTQDSKIIDALKKELVEASHDTVKLRILVEICDQCDPVEIPTYTKPAIEMADKLLNMDFDEKTMLAIKRHKAVALNNNGYLYESQGNTQKALTCYNQSVLLFMASGYKLGEATTLNNIGSIYDKLGNVPKALEFFSRSLKIQEKIGDKVGVARSLNNIAFIYLGQGDVKQALDYFNKSLNMWYSNGDKWGTARCLNNIGMVYFDHDKDSLALEYYQKSLKISEEIKDRQGTAITLSNIGRIYESRGDNTKALDNLFHCLKLFEEDGDTKGIANTNLIIGAIYSKQNKMAEAEKFSIKAYELSKKLGFPENIKNASGGLKHIYLKQGNFQKAFKYYQEEVSMRDSIRNDENFKNAQKQKAKYEYEKKAATDSLAHAKVIAIKNVEMKKQKLITWFMIAGLLLVGVVAFIIYRSLKLTRKQKSIIEKQKQLVDEQNFQLNQQNEEIRAQRDEISAQRDEISAQRDLVTEQKQHIETIHEELTDSIHYAEKIQKAVLPNNLKIKDKMLGEFFVLFKPKDIVSGDFYFVEQRKNKTFIAVADCTGHGVPGAFMSMLGISFLNEIIARNEAETAGEILNELRSHVIHSLQQKGVIGEQKDGMDITFIAIDTGTNKMQFAGANNPLWIVSSKQEAGSSTQSFVTLSCHPEPVEGLTEAILPTDRQISDNRIASPAVRNDDFQQLKTNSQQPTANSQLIEHKPDKMPVAIYENMRPFTNNELQLHSGDIIYLASDGYEDQFGGPKGKKFMSKKLKQMLVDNCSKSMAEQHEMLDKIIEDWKNNYGEKFEQTDDITVMGIKIT